MSFYNKYVALCRNADKTPSAVAEIIGIGKSNVTYWKNGRTKPTDLTLSKIADYFDVPISYFDEKENPVTSGDEVLSTKQVVLNSVDYIRSVCERKGVPISRLEKDCGFSNGYLNPKKLKKLPYDRAVIIANYLSVPVYDLLNGPGTENPANIGGEVLSVKQIEMIEKIKGMSKEDLDKKWAALSAIFDI